MKNQVLGRATHSPATPLSPSHVHGLGNSTLRRPGGSGLRNPEPRVLDNSPKVRGFLAERPRPLTGRSEPLQTDTPSSALEALGREVRDHASRQHQATRRRPLETQALSSLEEAADASPRGPGLTTFAPGESENKSRIDWKGRCPTTQPTTPLVSPDRGSGPPSAPQGDPVE